MPAAAGGVDGKEVGRALDRGGDLPLGKVERASIVGSVGVGHGEVAASGALIRPQAVHGIDAPAGGKVAPKASTYARPGRIARRPGESNGLCFGLT